MTVPVTAKVKLTLCTDERFFGPGVCELLERIRETGSIQAAAARMELSYTKAWKILNRAEKELGTSLITRVSGGRNGGSSTLTEAGEKAVADFREMEGKLNSYAEELLYARRDSFRMEKQGE
jgi:molybdate transport system regulatory protein